MTTTVTLSGRKSVFHGAVDYLYLPIETEISFTTNGRVMVVEAVASTPKPAYLRPAADVPCCFEVRASPRDKSTTLVESNTSTLTGWWR